MYRPCSLEEEGGGGGGELRTTGCEEQITRSTTSWPPQRPQWRRPLPFALRASFLVFFFLPPPFPRKKPQKPPPHRATRGEGGSSGGGTRPAPVLCPLDRLRSTRTGAAASGALAAPPWTLDRLLSRPRASGAPAARPSRETPRRAAAAGLISPERCLSSHSHTSPDEPDRRNVPLDLCSPAIRRSASSEAHR